MKLIREHETLVDIEAEQRGYERGYRDGMQAGADKALRNVREALPDLDLIRDSILESAFIPQAPKPTCNGEQAKRLVEAVAKPAPSGDFTAPQARVLRSLAMWQSLGHEAPSREMVAAAAGYKPSSGIFNNILDGLVAKGVIDKPALGKVSPLAPTLCGIDVADGGKMLLSVLTTPQRKLVFGLKDGTLSREELGRRTAYAPTSGGFNNLIGSLSTLGIVVKPMPGHVMLSSWAQELLV